MSWLARSLVNSLRGEEDQEDESKSKEANSDERSKQASIIGEDEQDDDGVEDPTRGVKEDLSQLTKTLTRQFWGVASFLAPPPSDPGQRSDPTASDDQEAVGSPRLAGIRSDFAEIGGRFKSGISMLSNTKAVTEISKLASTLLPFGEGEEKDGEESAEIEESYGGGAVGVTDEVVAFARNISMHPETWLDFPSVSHEDDADEFHMSDAQQEHALAVEHHAPRLAALRIELCPSHMSEDRFWKIYFVLLHSRLSKQDAELLTTPQITQARAMLLQDLQNRTKPKSEESGKVLVTVPSEETVIRPLGTSSETSSIESPTIEEPSTSVPITDIETEKHPVQTTEVKIIDKSVIEEGPPIPFKSEDFNSIDASSTVSTQKYEEDGDEWLKEDEVNDDAGGSRGTTIPLGNDEDVSFSDLEEDDDVQGKATSHAGESQLKDSKAGWVQLNKNSEGITKNKGSSDWLSLDDLDEEL